MARGLGYASSFVFHEVNVSSFFFLRIFYILLLSDLLRGQYPSDTDGISMYCVYFILWNANYQVPVFLRIDII